MDDALKISWGSLTSYDTVPHRGGLIPPRARPHAITLVYTAQAPSSSPRVPADWSLREQRLHGSGYTRCSVTSQSCFYDPTAANSTTESEHDYVARIRKPDEIVTQTIPLSTPSHHPTNQPHPACTTPLRLHSTSPQLPLHTPGPKIQTLLHKSHRTTRPITKAIKLRIIRIPHRLAVALDRAITLVLAQAAEVADEADLAGAPVCDARGVGGGCGGGGECVEEEEGERCEFGE